MTSSRPVAAVRAVAGYVRSAPGTFIWLAILGLTAIAADRLPADVLERVLRRQSTNLANLRAHAPRVLLTSAFWYDGGSWPMYAALYAVFHAQVERWLGTLRWLGVVVLAHVLATYLSQALVALAIAHHVARLRAAHALDFGVSYALAGVIAVLTYRLPRRWRWPYALAVLAGFALPFALGPASFTDVGHLVAALVGFAYWPIARSRQPGGPTTGMSDVRRLAGTTPSTPHGGRRHDVRTEGPTNTPLIRPIFIL